MIVRRASNLLREDISRRWSVWTWVCLAGCGASLVVLKARGNLVAAKGTFGDVDFLALSTLALCFLAGIVALARRGTTRTVPAIALLAIVLLAPSETLLAFSAVAEVPLLLLGLLIKHPIGLVVISTFFAVMLVLIAKKGGANRLVRALTELLRKEWRRPLGKLSLIGGILCIGMVVFLKEVGISFFLYGLIFRTPSWLLVRALLCVGLLLVALFFAMSPLWRPGENRLVPLLVVSAVPLMFIRQLLAAFLIGAWLLALPIIGLSLIIGLFLLVRVFWKAVVRS